jgi:hypothetical protein
MSSCWNFFRIDYLSVCFHVPCADDEGAAVNNAASAYKERMKVEIDDALLYNSQ